MDLNIVKNKVTKINFSKRKGINRSVSNWFKSSEKKAFLTLHNSFLNQDNELVVKFKAPTHIVDMINQGKIAVDTKEVFIPDEISEEINNLLDQQLRVKLGKANLHNLTFAHFL
jgi:hypothetical protein